MNTFEFSNNKILTSYHARISHTSKICNKYKQKGPIKLYFLIKTWKSKPQFSNHHW